MSLDEALALALDDARTPEPAAVDERAVDELFPLEAARAVLRAVADAVAAIGSTRCGSRAARWRSGDGAASPTSGARDAMSTPTYLRCCH
jgi:hypothetical protein